MFGKLTRSFTLPQEVDEQTAQAKLRDGVLELTLPKKAAASRKTITVIFGPPADDAKIRALLAEIEYPAEEVS